MAILYRPKKAPALRCACGNDPSERHHQALPAADRGQLLGQDLCRDHLEQKHRWHRCKAWKATFVVSPGPTWCGFWRAPFQRWGLILTYLDNESRTGCCAALSDPKPSQAHPCIKVFLGWTLAIAHIQGLTPSPVSSCLFPRCTHVFFVSQDPLCSMYVKSVLNMLFLPGKQLLSFLWIQIRWSRLCQNCPKDISWKLIRFMIYSRKCELDSLGFKSFNKMFGANLGNKEWSFELRGTTHKWPLGP